MGVVIESLVWEPKPQIYLAIFFLSFLSIFLLPFLSSKTHHLTIPSSFLRFQSSFLFIYSLASVNEGIQSVFGEFEYAYDGIKREEIVGFLYMGAAVSLVFGTFLSILSDVIGPKRICVTFCFLHVFAAIWKIVTMHPSGWITSILLGLASSVFPVCFETWMVTEHGKPGYKQAMLWDTLWLMTFFESASFIGSQVLANFLVGTNAEKGISFTSIAVLLVAVMIIIYINRQWKVTPFAGGVKDYMIALNACILHDKKIWLIVCAQASLHFSNTVFWILWAPTIVADGREVHLGLIYPCFMGARMLGSTAVPWFHSGFLQVQIEDCVIFAFSAAGLVFSVVAYDYQEIEVLVMFFCFFHVCVGILLPSLARLRTVYVPNELRGGMISLSIAPANAAVIFVLIQRSYFQNIENSTIMAFAAFGLFSAAGCMYLLKRKNASPKLA